jgi:hypothetical protein
MSDEMKRRLEHLGWVVLVAVVTFLANRYGVAIQVPTPVVEVKATTPGVTAEQVK